MKTTKKDWLLLRVLVFFFFIGLGGLLSCDESDRPSPALPASQAPSEQAKIPRTTPDDRPIGVYRDSARGTTSQDVPGSSHSPDQLYHFFARGVFAKNEAGLTSLQQDALWHQQYEGRRVFWRGTVDGVREAILGADVVVYLKCGDSGNISVKAAFDKRYRTQLLRVNKGDVIQFEGTLSGFGLLDADFEVKDTLLK